MPIDRALVVGASGGIGSAVSAELRSRGAEVVGVSRSDDGLDVTDEESVARVMGGLDGPFDLIFVATGALVIDGYEPEKAIKEVGHRGLVDQFAVNAAGPMVVLKHALPHLATNRPATVAVLSARVGSIGDNGIGGWHGYRASKAALNQLVHGAALELKRTHKQATVLCLHPGTVETPFTADYAGHHKTVPPDEAAANLIDVVEAKGTDDTGRFFDYAGEAIPW